MPLFAIYQLHISKRTYSYRYMHFILKTRMVFDLFEWEKYLCFIRMVPIPIWYISYTSASSKLMLIHSKEKDSMREDESIEVHSLSVYFRKYNAVWERHFNAIMCPFLRTRFSAWACPLGMTMADGTSDANWMLTFFYSIWW